MSASLIVLAMSGEAFADVTFCAFGSQAGQCDDPQGVAVDFESGEVFVVDRANNRVNVFDEEANFLRGFGWGVDTGAEALEVCTTASGCQVGLPGIGDGQFQNATHIAVDNDPASEAHQDIYVLSASRVQRFHPNGEFVLAFGEGLLASNAAIAVGPGGIVHVADVPSSGSRRVQKFDHEGIFLEEHNPLPPPTIAPEHFGSTLSGLVVDSASNFYLANGGGSGAVRKYDPAGNCFNCAAEPSELINHSFNIKAIAVDEADNLYVADRGGQPSQPVVNKYAPTATQLRAFGYGAIEANPPGIAARSTASGDVYATQGSGTTSKVVHFEEPPPGPVLLPEPDRNVADPIGNVEATLNAVVNPEGQSIVDFRFEYVDEQTFGESGYASAESVEGTLEAEPEDLFKLHPISALIGCEEPENPPQPSCLEPETEYRFRVFAENEDGEGNSPVEGTPFETRPIEIGDVWASDVGSESARIHAEVDPLGIETSGYFEYVEEATFGESEFAEAVQVPDVEGGEQPLDFGAGFGFLARSAQLLSLLSDTAYRYRVVAENAFGLVRESLPHAFETFALPKGKADTCPNAHLRAGASAALPDCRAHEMVSPEEKGGGDIEALGSLVVDGPDAELNQASPDGEKLTYSSALSFGDAISAPYTSQYIASRGGAGWSSHGVSPPREGGSYYEAGFDTQFKAFSEDLGLAWLLADSEPPLEEGAIAGFPGLYRRDNTNDTYQAICPVQPSPTIEEQDYEPKLQGSSADGTVGVFSANDALTPDASSEEGIFQLYGCREGDLRLLSVLPGGEANPSDSAVGTSGGLPLDHRPDSLHNAVSADGTRVYWTAAGGPGKIYLRENPFGEGAECGSEGSPCTVEVSEKVSPGAAQYWTASADGSVAIFSIGSSLYRYDAGAEEASQIAAGFSGLAGFSEDASRLYLLSSQVQPEAGQNSEGDEAVSGQPNLYLYQSEGGGEGSFDFIGTLPGGGTIGPSSPPHCDIATSNPFNRCSRATPDGLQLAFMSEAPLTGYDNKDAAGGVPAAEVFLYDATAGGGEGQLRCVSCNPSGGRPQARGFQKGPDVTWVAAQIPGWISSFHASRALSEDGRRLFFESFDPLVLADTNGRADVYQWEAPGKGSCTAAGASFVQEAGGCVELISSGEGGEDAEFVDASASGDDVFFKTAASLFPADSGLVDIYDARVGGGFPPPDPPTPPCEGEACQSPPPAPEEQTPATQAPGIPNVAPPERSRCNVPARKARRFAKRARRSARAARRSRAPRRSRAMRRKARRLSGQAKRLRRNARRCRARQGRGAER